MIKQSPHASENGECGYPRIYTEARREWLRERRDAIGQRRFSRG